MRTRCSRTVLSEKILNFEIGGVMIQYKNLDNDVDESREFLLISRTLQELNSEVRESAFASTITKTLVCEALDYVWGIARKRGNILDVYGNDLVVRCYRWELDRFAEGMASSFAEAFNWFRWESDGELVLINWLCRNNINDSETERRRAAAKEAKKEEIKERDRIRKRKEREQKNGVQESSHGCPSDVQESSNGCPSDVQELSGQCPDNHTCNNNNNNNNNIQKHVSCPELSNTPRPPISGSEALDAVQNLIRGITLPKLASTACSEVDWRNIVVGYFRRDTRGNAVGLLNLPSGPEKYLEKLYVDLSPYPPDVIRTAITNELQRPADPENPNDGMILQTMKRIIADSACLSKTAERADKERKRKEKIQSEAERERIAEVERNRDVADFEALCELLSEGTESDIESAIEERFPIGIHLSDGERKAVLASRTRYRKRIRKRIDMLKKEVKV